MNNLATVLKMYRATELAKLWKCSESHVFYKIRHESVTIRDWHSVMQAHPEHEAILIAALK